MRSIAAKRVVVAEEVETDPRCRDRAEAILDRISTPQLDTVAEAELPGILAAYRPRAALERGGLERRGQAKDLVVLARKGTGDVYPGYSWRERRDGKRELAQHGVLCHTAIELQSVVGCPYDCTYCPYSSFVCLWLDVDGFAEQVVRLVVGRKSQELFKLNNRSDTLGLEPEYGLAPVLVERFARLSGKYLMLYSKGGAIDALLDVDHRQRTVVCLTLTPAPGAQILEPAAPPIERRIDILGRLARAGYPIRVRLSPIVPIRNWREHYRDLLRRLAAACQPELLTLWTLSMIEPSALGRIVPETELDPDVRDTIAKRKHGGATDKGAPFSLATRVLLYRDIAAMARDILPSTPVSLCLERPEVWDAVGSVLVPRRKRSFICNCAPHATGERLRRLC